MIALDIFAAKAPLPARLATPDGAAPPTRLAHRSASSTGRLGAEPDQLGQPLVALHPQREGGEPSRGSQSWVHGEWRRFGQLRETSVVGS